MKYFILAGERSGDLHGSNLAKAIFLNDPNAQIIGWGGEYMQEAGVNLKKNYTALAFMGFWEVFTNLYKIIGFISECKLQIKEFNPDAIILIDYAGFNLRIAKWAKENNYKVFYYISPKVWAWNQKRAYKLKKYIDKLFVILPFEVSFFKKYDYEVEYVGNPLLDQIEKFVPNKNFRKEQNLEDKKIIALLPGSRKQEVLYMLSAMVSVVPAFPEYHFVISGVSNLPIEMYKAYLNDQISLVVDDTYNLLSNAESALVTSGTATLETGLFNIPQVVCYKTSLLSYHIARQLVKVKYASLVNLICEKEVVKELLQDDLNTENLIKELKATLTTKRATIFADYQQLFKLIGKSGASQKVGSRIVEILQSSK